MNEYRKEIMHKSSSSMMSTMALTMTRSAFSTLRSRKCRKCPIPRSPFRI